MMCWWEIVFKEKFIVILLHKYLFKIKVAFIYLLNYEDLFITNLNTHSNFRHHNKSPELTPQKYIQLPKSNSQHKVYRTIT